MSKTALQEVQVEATRLNAEIACEFELTILMPCLNEAETLATCIRKAKGFLARTGISGEVLIADNGSSDGSPELAEELGARVILVRQKGYGAALMGGIEAARGQYTIMGDADDSYDFASIDQFIDRLRGGADLVMGNRFNRIQPGAMPLMHRYLGNPVLSFIGRLFFHIPVSDFHCGLRGFNTAKIRMLGLQTTGMEFASEMIVRSVLAGFSIAEVPITLYPDGRSRPPHLRTWRDGWRHLKFLLMYSPRWLYLVPGFLLLGVGLVLAFALLFGPLKLANIVLDLNTLLVACCLAIAGRPISYVRCPFTIFCREKWFSAEPGDRGTHVAMGEHRAHSPARWGAFRHRPDVHLVTPCGRGPE